MSDSQDEYIKVVLLGESGVGKTNLINILTGGEFNENEKLTMASSFLLKKIKVNDKEYTIQIWDTIGHEKLRTLTKLFYTNSKIVIFVYDISVKASFEALKDYWINDVEQKLGKDIIKGVVGNKIDLFLNQQVSQEEGQEYAESIGAQFLETSAKSDNPKKFEDFLINLFEQFLNKNVANPSGPKTLRKTKSIYLNRKDSVSINTRKKCC